MQQTKPEACVVIRDVEGVERRIPVQSLLRHPIVASERQNAFDQGYNNGFRDNLDDDD